MASDVTMLYNGHQISMQWAAGVEGSYCWVAMCDCGKFAAQGPTWASCANLCEEHLAEQMLS